jgi:hypothetical protein
VLLTFNSNDANTGSLEHKVEDQPDKKRDIKNIEPNQTLYIKNLNEKIKKDGKYSPLSLLFNLWAFLTYL